MLKISTYTHDGAGQKWRPGNNIGGQTAFKALGHPKAAEAARRLVESLARFRRLAVYDPDLASLAEEFECFYDLTGHVGVSDVFVQRVEALGAERLGRPVRLVPDLADARPEALLITAFDADRYKRHIAPLLPGNCQVFSLDEMRLPADWLAVPRNYLDPLNFATNLAFFRDGGGLRTKVSFVNYWQSYGAKDTAMWLCLFDGEGRVLAEWTEPLPPGAVTFTLDSAEIRRRFGLGPFAGSLFMHALRPAGHDVIKYVVDVSSDDRSQLSATHDANAWPADLYAGIPAPADGERLVLWAQNAHPIPVPAGAIGFNRIGRDDVVPYPEAIPPFGTRPIDVGALLPAARWPDQIELRAGRYLVRPRYEVTRPNAQVRIAHANVERTDLAPDPQIPALGGALGKGYIMPLPVPPLDAFRTRALPTPMATTQAALPLKAVLYDGSGEAVAETYLGRVERTRSVVTDVDAWLAETGARLASGFGHLEYLYDFREGGEADGWLHAIGIYEQRANGHRSETSFGAHIYNTPAVYRDEPQSYSQRPPGLTTRLFLRLGGADGDTMCHLIYPASTPWVAQSSTVLALCDRAGTPVGEREVRIPCGGSLHWRLSRTFTEAERRAAGPGGYVEIRDSTCRLFGYHGIVNDGVSFSIDHMFGF